MEMIEIYSYGKESVSFHFVSEKVASNPQDYEQTHGCVIASEQWADFGYMYSANQMHAACWIDY